MFQYKINILRSIHSGLPVKLNRKCEYLKVQSVVGLVNWSATSPLPSLLPLTLLPSQILFYIYLYIMIYMYYLLASASVSSIQ